jgi:predicted N-acyltransferase
MLQVKVFQSITEIDKDAIDSISDDPFFTFGWFRTLETLKYRGITPIYLAVYSENNIVGFAPFFIESIEHTSNNLISKFMNLVIRIAFHQNHVLSSLSPFCARSKILFSNDQEKKVVLDLITKRIDAICKKKKILISQFSYVSEFDKVLIDNIQNYGYQKYPGITTFYLDVKWTSFEDYIKEMKQKNRESLRRQIRKCKENGVTIELSEMGNLTKELSDLTANLFLKYRKKEQNFFDSSFFDMLNTYAEEKIRLFIAKKNGEVIGFSLLLLHRDVIDGFLSGFNYDIQTKTDFTYFNLCYYVPIKWAIENGLKKIYAGGTTKKVKLDRLFKPEETYFLIKYHNRLLSTLDGIIMQNPLLTYFKSLLLKLSL